MPQRVEATQRHEFNTDNDSVGDLGMFRYLEHVEIIADSECQPLLPPQP